MDSFTSTINKAAEDVVHFNLVTRRYTAEGVLRRWNAKCRCIVAFDDFNDSSTQTRISEAIKKAPKLDGSIAKLAESVVQALSSELNLNEASPDIFHNTYVIFNDLAILQLKNTKLLATLQQKNSELLSKDAFKGQQPDPQALAAAEVGLLQPEDLWLAQVQEQVINNIITLNPDAPLPALFRYPKIAVETATLGFVAVAFAFGVLEVIRRYKQTFPNGSRPQGNN